MKKIALVILFAAIAFSAYGCQIVEMGEHESRLFWDNVLGFQAKSIGDGLFTPTTKAADKNITNYPGLPKTEAEKINKDNYLTITMPNGTTVKLADIIDKDPISSSNCMLSNADIQGQVSYAGRISDDLYMGHTSSLKSLKNQHITGTYLRAAVGDYDTSVVLPKMYEEFYNLVTAVDSIDTLMTMSMMLSYKGLAKNVKESEKETDKLLKGAKEASEKMDEIMKTMGNTLEAMDEEVAEKVIGEISEQGLRKAAKEMGIADAESMDLTALRTEIKNRVASDPNNLTHLRTTLREEPYALDKATELIKGKVNRTESALRSAGFSDADVRSIFGGSEIKLENLDVSVLKSKMTNDDTLRKNISTRLFGNDSATTDEIIAKMQSMKNAKSTLKKLEREGADLAKTAQELDKQVGDMKGKMEEAGIPVDKLDEVCKKEKNVSLCKEEINKLNNAYKSRQTLLAQSYKIRVVKSIFNNIYGMFWLGPVQSILSLAPVHDVEIDSEAPNGAYVRLYVNKDRKGISGISSEALELFRGMHLGFVITDTFLKDIVGKNPKLLEVGNLFLINSATYMQPDAITSTTSIRKYGKGLEISTNWQGGSEVVAFEDPKSWKKDTTSLPLQTNKVSMGAVVNTDEKSLKQILAMGRYTSALLFATYGGAGALQAIKTMKTSKSAIVYTYALPFMFELLPSFLYLHNFKYYTQSKVQEPCDVKKLRMYEIEYAGAVIVEQGMDLIQTMAPQAILFGIPLSALDIYVMALGEGTRSTVLMDADNYLGNCQDESYKILTQQTVQVSGAAGVIEDLKKQFSDVGDVIKNSSVFDVIKGVGSDVEKVAQTEILHLKAGVENQVAHHYMSDLTYFHVLNANIDWFNTYSNKGCFRIIYDGNDSYIEQTRGGVYYIDKTTGKKVLIATADQSKMAKMMEGFAMTILPTRILKTDRFDFNVKKVGQNMFIYVTNSCMNDYIKKITNQNLSLSGIAELIGPIRSIYTDVGKIAIDNDGKIRLQYIDGGEIVMTGNIGIKGGIVRVIGTGKYLESKAQKITDALSVDPIETKKEIKNPEFGKLVTLITSNARLENTDQGYVFAIYASGSDMGSNIDNIRLTPSTKNDPVCGPVMGFKAELAGLTTLANPISAIQSAKEGGQGLQVFETENYIYQLTVDAKCNQIFRLYNKATGQWQTFNVTGAMKQTENGVILPTDKGDVKINLNQHEGQPIININGPGFSEKNPFLFARGPGGMWAYDPSTGMWYAYNGQGIPLDPNFAKRGMSFDGRNGGIYGVPGSNVLAPFLGAGRSGVPSPFLALPTQENKWDNIGLLAIIGAMAVVAWISRNS